MCLLQYSVFSYNYTIILAIQNTFVLIYQSKINKKESVLLIYKPPEKITTIRYVLIYSHCTSSL